MTDPLAELSDRGVSIWLDDYADARQVLSDLEALGIDYGDVTEGLERNGLAAFDATWRELGDQLRSALAPRTAREESSI